MNKKGMKGSKGTLLIKEPWAIKNPAATKAECRGRRGSAWLE
jgi:hypothetical protein